MREREGVAWFNGIPRVVSLFFTFEDRSSGERRRGKRGGFAGISISRIEI